MKNYILLRDNKESGPHKLEELSGLGLKPTDLIWIENGDNIWHYPEEIEELKKLVPIVENDTQEEKKDTTNMAQPKYVTRHVFVALPTQPEKITNDPVTIDASGETKLETKYEQPLDEIKEMYVAHLKNSHQNKNKRKLKPAKIAWLVALVCGLLVGTFIIKKTIENNNSNTLTGAVTASAAINPAEGDPAYQNALATENVPVDSAMVKATKKGHKKVNLKKLVSLNANSYKVGVFGGINNLQLVVNNKSNQLLQKVFVVVDYLKPNGSVVQTENFSVNAVAPSSSKMFAVPASKRGVKVKYRITHINAQPAEMLNL